MKTKKPTKASDLSHSATYSFDNHRFVVRTEFRNSAGVNFKDLLVRIIVNDVTAPSETSDKTASRG